MAIAISCVGCTKNLNIPEMCLGKKMKCRYCGVLFLMPLPMAGRPSLPIQLNEFAASATGTFQPLNIPTPSMQPAARRTGIFPVPKEGEVVGSGTGKYQMVVSETGVYEAVKNPGQKTAYFPRIMKSQTGTFRAVSPQSGRYTAVRKGGRSSSSYSVVPYKTGKFRPVGDKTHRYNPVGSTAMYSPVAARIKSSADMNVVPPRGNPGFNILQIGTMAALIFVGLLGFVFFFSSHANNSKKTSKETYVEIPIVPVVQKIHEVEPVTQPNVSAPSATPLKRTSPTASPAARPAGSGEALSRAVGDLSSTGPSVADQAATFSQRGQHDQAAKMYEKAAEEADRAGREQEAQAFSLKSIEERRAQDDRGSSPIQTAAK